MKESALEQLDLPSEYDSAVANTYKFLNLGWLMISLYVAVSLVYFSGAEYRSVILYALGAPLAYFSTSWIKREPWDQFRLIPVIAYLFWLPLQVNHLVTNPWYSIGFVAICASFSSIVFNKISLSIALISICGVVQYYFARMNLIGISDTGDTLLLNSYFSTSWVLITGISGLFIIKNYYAVCKDLDSALEEVENEYWERSENISKLNLKDHINLKLHGTLLNTLIVAQKMKGLLTNEGLSQQIKKELEEINLDNNFSSLDLRIEELVTNQVNFGRLDFKVNSDPRISIEAHDVDLIIELVREVILNINKHTNSQRVTINFALDAGSKILITIKEDLSSILTMNLLAERALMAMQSKSLHRLCAKSYSTYTVNSYSNGSILHIINTSPVDRDLNILRKTKEIRRRSLNTFVRNISAVSAGFTILAIPAFIYLNVPKSMVLIISICLVIHLYLLISRRLNVFLIFILVALPLALVPLAYSTSDVCTNMESLPWMINSLLGAFLFGSYFSSNVVLRWVPGVFLLVECLSVNFFFPEECTSLLNGTTPGIAIALILARNLISRRSRNAALDQQLEGELRLQSGQNDEVKEKVTAARDLVLDKVRLFADRSHSNGSYDDQLGSLINLVRAYLLCSEKFEKQFFRDLFSWVFDRFDRGLSTSLEIYELNYSSVSLVLDFNKDFSIFTNSVLDKDLSISLTFDDRVFVEISTESDVSEVLKYLNEEEKSRFTVRQVTI